jgi:pSer/pThr/pTyr-binding forkhead associated (FHA) protein
MCVPVQVYTQTIKGDFDLSNYPEVSFVWNEYNPELKDSTQFILSVNEEKIPFRMESVSRIDTIVKNKSILFLWEDLNHRDRKGQSDFTKQLLYNFLNEVSIQADDKFNVAIFDRKGGNDIGSSIHTLLSEDFTKERNQLANMVLNFSNKYDFFSNQINSELYLAMEEGIELLKKESADRIRVLIVITAGSNQGNYGGKGDFDTKKAVEMKIPIYLIKYPILHCEHCTNINQISTSSFGQQIETKDVSLAKKLLLECYKEMNQRHYGQDYSVSFRTNFPRDGYPHTLLWSVNGKEYALSFVAPSFSLTKWIQEHTLYTVLISLGLLIIISLMIVLLCNMIKKRNQELMNLKSKQQVIELESNKNRKELEDLRQQKEEEHKVKEKEQEQYFINLMQIKNFAPRLYYSFNGFDKNHTIYKSEITIGRNEDNDIILLSDSVSRHHAKMVFNGSGFEIQDLNSTNKTMVNGRFVQQTKLSNGDTIKLGEITICFYI